MAQAVGGVGALAGASVVDSFINALARIGASILRGVIDIVRRPSVLYALLTVLPGIIRQFANFIQQVGIDVSGFAQSILQFANYVFNTVYNYVISKLPQPSGAFSWLAPIVDALAIVPTGILALPFYIAGYIVEYVVSPLVQFFVSIELIVLNGVYTFLCKYVVPLLGYYFSVYLGYEAFKHFVTRGRLTSAVLGGLLGGLGGFLLNTELQALLSIIGMGCQQQLVSMPTVSITVTQLPSALVQLGYGVSVHYNYEFTTGGLVKGTYSIKESYNLFYGCLNCVRYGYVDSEKYSLSVALPKGRYYFYEDSLAYSITIRELTSISLSSQQSIAIPISVNYQLLAQALCNTASSPVAFYVVCDEQASARDYGLGTTPPSSGCSVGTTAGSNMVSISCTENATASDTGSG